MATPASGVKPTNASQAIKGSERSSMSPEFLSGDKNSKQDAAKKGLRNLEQESATGGFYNNGAGEDAGDVDASRFSENNPDSGYTNAVSGYDDEEDDEEDEPSRARKGPLVAILGAILTLGAVMGGSQAMLPFSLLEQLKSTYDSISTSMQSRSRVFLRKQLNNGNLQDPIKKKYFGFMKGSGATFSLSDKQRAKLESEGIHTADIKDANGNTRTIMLFDDGSGSLKVVTPDADLAEDISAGRVKIGDDVTINGMHVDIRETMDFETKFSDSADFRNGYIKSSRTWRGAIGAWFDTMTVRFLQSNNLTRNRFKNFQDRVNAEAEGNTRSQIIADAMKKGAKDVDLETGGKERSYTYEDSNGNSHEVYASTGENGKTEFYYRSDDTGLPVTVRENDIKYSNNVGIDAGKVDTGNPKSAFQGIYKSTAKKFAENSGLMSMGANGVCAIAGLVGAVEVAVSAHQGLQLVQLVSSYFEAIDKVRAGDGVDSPINDMAAWLTQPNATMVAQSDSDNDDPEDEAFYKTKEVTVDGKENTSAMQSSGIASLYGGGRINYNDPSVQNFNISSAFSSVLNGMGVAVSSFTKCAAAKMSAAIIGAGVDVAKLIICLIPGAGWIACLGEKVVEGLGSSIATSVAVGLAIQSAAKAIVPIFVSRFSKDLLSGIAGEDLGNALMSGANIMMATNARLGGQSVASRSAYIAYKAEQEKVLAEKAKYERETLSPFDTSSQYTFFGSLQKQLVGMSTIVSTPMSIISSVGGLVSGAIKSLLPSASAIDISDTLMTEEEFERICPNLASIGAVGDAYCNPYVVTDVNTLGMDPESLVDALAATDQIIGEDDTTEEEKIGRIKKNSNLAKYILYCDNRSSAFGIADTNISSNFEYGSARFDASNSGSEVLSQSVDSLNTVIDSSLGAIPIIGDTLDIISNVGVMHNMGWISGESCVIGNTAGTTIANAEGGNTAFSNDSDFVEAKKSSGSIDWEEAKLYQRYVEDQRLLESMDSEYKSTVSIFLDEYYEENPLDESYEGILARASGLSKETVVAMLEYVDYVNYIASYDPSERMIFGEDELLIEDSKEDVWTYSSAIGNIFTNTQSFDIKRRMLSSQTA